MVTRADADVSPSLLCLFSLSRAGIFFAEMINESELAA